MSEDTDTAIYIKIGPVGSGSGTDWDEKGHTHIVRIFVSHDTGINSLQFQYLDNNALVLSTAHGSNEGFNFDVVKLAYPMEHITYISGYRSSDTSHVCSLTFGTNKGEHGPYGQHTDKDKAFRFYLGDDKEFGGFYGSADAQSVKSIGVYLKPITSFDAFQQADIVKLTEDVEKWEMLNGGKRVETVLD